MNKFTKQSTIAYVLSKMLDGYGLTYARPPYMSYLSVPQGGHHRNVSHVTVKRMIKRDLIIRASGKMSSFARFELTGSGRTLAMKKFLVVSRVGAA